MEALRVEDLCKEFGAVHVLQNVSFSVETGELLAIIGPNGAGKTTLFNILDGQLEPSAGRVIFYEQDVTHLASYSRAHLGMARSFQLTTLFLDLTVLDNVMLAFHGNSRSRFQMFRPITSYAYLYDKAHRLLERINLWEKRDELVAEISYGEQRKLEITVSMASNPKLLLLDEPNAGLTAAETKDIGTLIRDLGIDATVLVVAHDMDFVFNIAKRIIVLHNGQIITEGTCDEIRYDLRVKELYTGIEANAT